MLWPGRRYSVLIGGRHLGLGLYALYEGIKLHRSMLKEQYAGTYVIIRYIVGYAKYVLHRPWTRLTIFQ
jgi:hypothetical protein